MQLIIACVKLAAQPLCALPICFVLGRPICVLSQLYDGSPSLCAKMLCYCQCMHCSCTHIVTQCCSCTHVVPQPCSPLVDGHISLHQLSCYLSSLYKSSVHCLHERCKLKLVGQMVVWNVVTLLVLPACKACSRCRCTAVLCCRLSGICTCLQPSLAL